MLKIMTIKGKGPLSILALLWLPFMGFSQKEAKTCSVNNVQCQYALDNGQMNGVYTSFYANGTKKAEGQFQHNTRIGKWTIWDSTGAMLHQRMYENNAYDFSVLFHKTDRDKTFSTEKQINLIRDTNGLAAFPKVVDKEIVHSQRYWRMVSNKAQNPALFDNNTFFNWLSQSVLEGKIKAYSPIKDDFRLQMKPEDVKKTMDSLDVELVGFRTKEMTYYTSTHQISHSVVLGLAPIVRSKKSDKSGSDSPLFWIRLPNSRKEFSQKALPNLEFPMNIKTYDDLFFNRYFSSTIIKISNVKNLYLGDSWNTEEAKIAAQKLDMDIIDLEHNLWVFKPEVYAKK
jgi:hypothetical protein